MGFSSYLLQCFQALVHSQSISQCSGSGIVNSILLKAVEKRTSKLLPEEYKIVHTNVGRYTHIFRYRICSNLKNVLIIGMPNFNYLIRSNSQNERIFEINNHCNCLNGQLLLSCIFPAIMSCLYYQLPMKRYVAGNLQSA